MKILYYFPELSVAMMQWQRVHFFDELFRHGIEFEVFNPLLFDSIDEANDNLLIHIKEQQYDLFLANLCNEQHIHAAAIDEIRRMGIPTMSFRSDNLVMPYNDKELASHFDLLWLTSKETKYLYDKWGANTYFAPYAANPFVFHFSQPNYFVHHVCFIGTPYGSRTRMMNVLLENNIDLTLFYGKSEKTNKETKNTIETRQKIQSLSKIHVLYNRLCFHEGRRLTWGTIVDKISGKREIIQSEHLFREKSVDCESIGNIYSQYTLSLASTSAGHTDVLQKPVKVINLRNFEIPMSGGIEICRYNPELAEYFEEGKEILFYRDKNELIDKAKYYTQKASDKEILSIKKAARLRAENEHTWMNRFKMSFDILGLKY